MPALGRLGRRTVSSRPTWATYWDPATNKRKQKYLLINFVQCWQSSRARLYTLWVINQTHLLSKPWITRCKIVYVDYCNKPLGSGGWVPKVKVQTEWTPPETPLPSTASSLHPLASPSYEATSCGEFKTSRLPWWVKLNHLLKTLPPNTVTLMSDCRIWIIRGTKINLFQNTASLIAPV